MNTRFAVGASLAVVLLACSSSEDQTDGATSTGDSTSSSGGGSVAFTPASHEAAPQVVDNGGTVMKTPKVVAIEYASDAMTSVVDDFLPKFAASSFWPAGTAEYGVGALTIGAPIHRTEAAPTGKIEATELLADLQANTTGANPAWGAADAGTIYLFVLPAGAEVDAGGYCCESYDGFHDEALFTGVSGGAGVSYSMVCQCPGIDGPDVDAVAQLTVVISHELVEAVTDPYTEENPAYGGIDTDHAVWGAFTGGETADMCAINSDQYYVPVDLGYTVQRTWSDAAARAGSNPCVPADTAEPYFNAVPKLDDDVTVQGEKTKGVKIPIGQSKTIEVDLFSDGPTDAPWTVEAKDLSGDNELQLSFDKTSGRNGDKLMLTITPLKADPGFGAEAFMLSSVSGAHENIWMGVVTN